MNPPAQTGAPPSAKRPKKGNGVTTPSRRGGSGRSLTDVLVVIHHLAVDAISWRIIHQDLAAAARDELLEPAGTSLRRWAGILAREATSPARVAEASHWINVSTRPGTQLADKPLDPARDIIATMRETGFTLGPAQTAPLLTSVPAQYRCGVDDILLAAVTIALAVWRSERGQQRPRHRALLLEIERHGRADLGGADLSRTVGWFTSAHPVLLDPGAHPRSVLHDSRAADQAVKTIKEQIRRQPGDGLGFGLLRYLNPDAGPALSTCPRPEVAFNYLGRYSTAQTEADWTPVTDADPLYAGQAAGASATHAIDVSAWTQATPDGPRLTMRLAWPEAVLQEGSAQRLTECCEEALSVLAALGTGTSAGGLTPSDVPLAGLGQEEIDLLQAEWSNP